jgi:hypothetical protein
MATYRAMMSKWTHSCTAKFNRVDLETFLRFVLAYLINAIDKIDEPAS